MTTGVHAAWVLAAVCRTRCFVDGQRVHVGAQAQPAGAAAIAQHADHAGLADTGVHFIAPCLQQSGDQCRGAAFFKAQFRVSVDIVTNRVQVAGHVGEPGLDMLMSGHVESPRAGGFPFLLFAFRSRQVRQVVLGSQISASDAGSQTNVVPPSGTSRGEKRNGCGVGVVGKAVRGVVFVE
ncbi:hypothetical protein D3C80_1438030 [compost metagenome]